MCISAAASFTMSGFLMAGGFVSLYAASRKDKKYIALALFPLLVGIQQFAEGYVWQGLNFDDRALATTAALVYLFFVWMIWPFWISFMTAQVEPRSRIRMLLYFMAGTGLGLGTILYLPYYWNPDWVNPQIIYKSISYECTLLTDSILPRRAVYAFYLLLVGLPPLLSSYRSLRIFGAGLIAAVPLTYSFFIYSNISVLCFFAAAMTLYLIYIILKDKLLLAGQPPASPVIQKNPASL